MRSKYYLFFILFLVIFTLNAEANLLINSSLSQEFKVDNKEFVKGKIKAKNTSDKKINIRLYKRDYSFNAAGKSYYIKPGEGEHSNAKWITIDKKNISLAPFEQKDLEYKIEVPHDIIKKGSYWSMIMIEEFKEGKSDINTSKEVGVKQKIRYGIQIITDFENNRKIDLSFHNAEVNSIQAGKYLFEVDIYNRGISFLNAYIKLLLVNNKTGEILKEFSDDMNRIYPKTSIKLSESFNLNKKGSYKLILLLGNNKDGYFGKKYKFKVNNDH